MLCDFQHPFKRIMLIEILKRTPPWVYVLFFALLGIGLLQARTRVVSVPKALALPIAMVLLGIYSAFHSSLVASLAWLFAVAIALYLARFFRYPRGIVFDPETRSLSIPGSWAPLVLMMAIYFTKYGVAVALSRHPALAASRFFGASVSAAYGFISGLFLAGAVSVWKTTFRGKVT